MAETSRSADSMHAQLRRRVLDFKIHADAYELWVDGRMLARLDGGAGSLLLGAGPRLRELDIETAIERAEDWLMPASHSFQEFTLHVADMREALSHRLGNAECFTPHDIEGAFTSAFDDVAFRRPIDSNAVADLVLLRELVHHGRLSPIVLEQSHAGPS